MPELPDVTVYVERLDTLARGQRLLNLRLANPFILRTYAVAPETLKGRALVGTRRIGKRIVLAFEPDYFAVIHLMIAGRIRQRPVGDPIPKKLGLLAFDFENTTFLLTEAGSKRRASLHLVQGEAELAGFHRGGIDPLRASPEEFQAALLRENRTLKRALTDPTILDGIGNAYSDEILFEARLSPVRRTAQLDSEAIERLHRACRRTLTIWIEKTRLEVGGGFPEKVTAFRDGMAVHGRYQKPCPRCSTAIQRIRYADNELNYCPRCQTEGKLLADRGLSRLLKGDWPKTIADLEEIRGIPEGREGSDGPARKTAGR